MMGGESWESGAHRLMPEQPGYRHGRVAFLFTDVAASTARWERDADAMDQ